jgi:hypothetical protein
MFDDEMVKSALALSDAIEYVLNLEDVGMFAVGAFEVLQAARGFIQSMLLEGINTGLEGRA